MDDRRRGYVGDTGCVSLSASEIAAGLSQHPEDELVRVELEEAQKKKRTGWKRWVMIGVSVATIALTFAFVLPHIADYRAVWDVIKGLSWQWIVGLGVAAVINVATFGPPWMAALPGLSYLHSSRLTLESTAISVVAPGGGAAGMAASFGMLKAWGFAGRPVGLAVTVTSIWNQLMILGVPIVAVAALVAQGDRNRTLEWVALISLAVFCVMVAAFAVGLANARLTRRIGDKAAHVTSWAKGLLHKAPVTWNGEAFTRFREESIMLVRARWWYLTLTTLANHLSVFLLLIVSVRAVGITPSAVTMVEAFGAWAVSRVIGSLAPTPGGIGFVELGLVGILVAFGASNAEAVTASLVYRVLMDVPTLALGLLASATFKVGAHPGKAGEQPAV
jgi:putative heme transporter